MLNWRMQVLGELEARAKDFGVVWLKIDPDVIAATGMPRQRQTIQSDGIGRRGQSDAAAARLALFRCASAIPQHLDHRLASGAKMRSWRQ